MFDFDFGLGEDIDLLRESVAALAADTIAPRAEAIDANNEFPLDLWPQPGAPGLLGITVEEQYGGANLGYLANVVAMEEISRASASVGLSSGAHSNLCVNQIRRWGNDSQKERYLPKLVSGEHLGALAQRQLRHTRRVRSPLTAPTVRDLLERHSARSPRRRWFVVPRDFPDNIAPSSHRQAPRTPLRRCDSHTTLPLERPLKQPPRRSTQGVRSHAQSRHHALPSPPHSRRHRRARLCRDDHDRL